jgi:hypothetical protein
MKKTIKIFVRSLLAVLLLAAGFAAGYPFGQHAGFTNGTEWAMVQADIAAREAGVYMPVVLDSGAFKVILKQPRRLYRNAWTLSDNFDSWMRLRNRAIEKECPDDYDGATDNQTAAESTNLITVASGTAGQDQSLQQEQRGLRSF